MDQNAIDYYGNEVNTRVTSIEASCRDLVHRADTAKAELSNLMKSKPGLKETISKKHIPQLETLKKLAKVVIDDALKHDQSLGKLGTFASAQAFSDGQAFFKSANALKSAAVAFALEMKAADREISKPVSVKTVIGHCNDIAQRHGLMSAALGRRPGTPAPTGKPARS